MKTCFRCKETKDLSDFYQCKRDGYQSACKDCKRSLKNGPQGSDKIYYIKHKNKHNAKTKEYYHNHKDTLRPKMNEYQKNYSKLNRAACNANLVKYRASQLQATPKWANIEAIKEIYLRCPKGMEVDHIIPLQGKNVRGLHVEYNLQYLSIRENRRKGNRV